VEKFGAASQATGNNIIWHMHFACWITKSRDTQSEYVTLSAFPWKSQLHEHASVLHYTYTACLVMF